MSRPATFKVDTNPAEALSDGIFAIVMTLLILELRVPELEHSELGQLPARLIALWPKVLTYLLSFISLGVYWVGHRQQFAFIHKADRGLLWINVSFLMMVALIPFSAALLGHYPLQSLPTAIYGLNLILVGVALWWHWRYATQYGLTGDDLPVPLRSTVERRILTGPTFYLLAVLLSLLSPRLSLVIFIVVPLYYIFPAGFDRLLGRTAKE